jgi:hypothetical protein
MNRLCASVSFGLALMASVAMGANIRTVSQQGPTLGGPTLISQGELPAPAAPLPAGQLSPTPEIQYSGPPSQLPVVTATQVELFPCVRYRAERNIAPCAVPVIVQVPDPCTPRDRCCCTPRPCVNVQICVPQCGCPTVCVTRNGNKTRYDYGKYAVNVISLNGRIVVDYDD